MRSRRVPVLVISGPGGVGKTTTAWELRDLLRDRNIAHAYIDIDNISWYYDPASLDRFNTRLAAENLRSVWRNYRNAGARRLVISGVLETSEQLRLWQSAIPNADFLIFELRATQETIRSRLRSRSDSTSLDREAARSNELAAILAANRLARYAIDTEGLTKAEVAAKILSLSEWDT